MANKTPKNVKAKTSKHPPYHQQFDDISAAVLVAVPPLGEIITVNPEAEELTGYHAVELCRLRFPEIFCLEDQPRIHSLFAAPLSDQGQFRKLFEHNVIIQKRSKRKVIVDMGFRLAKVDDRPVYIFTLQDITDLKNSETKIRQANDYVTAILNSMKESVFVIDLNGKIKTVNQPALALLGYRERDLTRRPIGTLFEQEPEGGIRAWTTPGAAEFEAVLRARSERSIPVLVSVSALNDPTEKSPLFVVVAMDMTERKKAERLIAEQHMLLVQAAKMSSLGEMASGVAHEINNPLHVIKGHCELLEAILRSKPGDVVAIQAHLSTIYKMSQRIESIVDGLRTFSRDQREDPFEEASLADIIQETLLLCETRIKNKGVDLRLSGIDQRLRLNCRPTQISQVILNLLNNAIDAVESDRLPEQERFIALEIDAQKHEVLITITNGGPRIDTSVASKIFSPFFTTKAVGKGTGLGLSISRSIVEEHGGAIALAPKSRHTRFEVKLPKVGQAGLKRTG